jgi:hypothetical protein
VFWLIAISAASCLRAPPFAAAASSLAAFGFVPYAWQRALPFDHVADVAGEPFRASYLASHFATAVREWLVHPEWLGHGAPVVAAGAAFGVAAVVRAARQSGLRAPEWAAVAAASGMLGAVVVVFAYHWGDVAQPNTARLGLPFAMIVLALAMVAVLGIQARRLAAGLCAAVGVAGAFAAVRDDHYRALSIGPALNAAAEWRRASLPCRVAWVTPYAGYFVVDGESAFAPWRTASLWPVLRERAAAGQIDRVLLLTVGDRAGRPYVYNVLPDAGYERVELARLHASRDTVVRIEALDRSDATLGAAPCVPPSTTAAGATRP